MAIQAKQEINANWDYKVEQQPLTRPDGERSKIFANVRTDTGEELGYSTSRYGIVNNADLLGTAETAFENRGLGNYERNIYVTDNGSKVRAIYDFKGDDLRAVVPQVGDVMGFRLSVQNSFDRSLKVSFALGFLRLICTNGMQTMERELSMIKKHNASINIADLITESALDKALEKLKGAADVYASLATVNLTQEQGLTILNNMTPKFMSDKVREGIAGIWNKPTHEEDKARNLYNLNNAVTQHLTHDVSDTRFEYANRMGQCVLKEFSAAALNEKRLKKLWTPAKNDAETIVVTE
jgi:hypothetical protein